MRDIDSDALRLVASSLGVANPVTAVGQVVFDDANLQQVLDVSRLLPGFGIGDGFFFLDQLMSHEATGTLFDARDVYDLAATNSNVGESIDRNRSRIWLMSVQLERDAPAAGDSVTLVSAGVTVAIGGIGSAQEVDVLLATANRFAAPLTAAGREPGVFSGQDSAGDPTRPSPIGYRLPLRLDPGSQLLATSAATIAVGPEDAYVSYLMWAGPRGLNPPGVA